MKKAPARDERGSVLVMACMVITVSVLFLALVLDLGRVWIVRARLQAAADAATLAAVQNAQVLVEKKKEPIIVTEFFGVSEQLPAEGSIQKKEPRYEYRPVRNRHGTVIGWEPRLIGWDVTYIKELQDVVVGWDVLLDPGVARATAGETLMQNALRWRDDPGVGIPVVEADDVIHGGHTAAYSMRASVTVESSLLGPLLAAVKDDVRYRYLTVRVFSESVAGGQ